MHSHQEAQLTFAVSGMVEVHTDKGRWLAPPGFGVWIPAGVSHRVEVLRTVASGVCPIMASRCTGEK